MSYNRRRNRSGRRYAVDTIEDNTGKYLIALDHGCYICGHVYSSAATARNHIRNIHGYNILSRINGINRPLDRNYNYVMRKDTDKYDEAHYACPSCWFHCPMDELAVFHDHTIKQHRPGRIIIESENEYGMDMDVDNRGRGPASRPHSRPSSRQINHSTSSRPSSRQGYVSDGEEEVSSSRPNSRQVRISDEREDIFSVSEDNKNELYQKMDELKDLFRALLK
ncbi:hypothetical protein BDF21DRAFT_463457 [Thamnidium elegans]|nr:hypothetical protein BDF21DRAFT_463457 [Thamnidium elegans]